MGHGATGTGMTDSIARSSNQYFLIVHCAYLQGGFPSAGGFGIERIGVMRTHLGACHTCGSTGESGLEATLGCQGERHVES